MEEMSTIIYKAFDGTVFLDEMECFQHEKFLNDELSAEAEILDINDLLVEDWIKNPDTDEFYGFYFKTERAYKFFVKKFPNESAPWREFPGMDKKAFINKHWYWNKELGWWCLEDVRQKIDSLAYHWGDGTAFVF